MQISLPQRALTFRVVRDAQSVFKKKILLINICSNLSM